VQQPTSRPRRDKPDFAQAGFTILEMVCVIAIMSILACLALPRLASSTSNSQLQSYALATAALLKGDRAAALRHHRQVVTTVNTRARLVTSGATGGSIQFPADVRFDSLLAAHCNDRSAGSEIAFFPSGLSCGGVITLGRPGTGYEVRVNWLTGGIEVVPQNRA
jgi:general secretion pathway protein H